MSLSRREALTLFLGAALGAAACRRPRPRVAGQIRGAAIEVGHRLRGATPMQARGEPQRVEIAIVGAGPSGLSAAWRLERLEQKRFVVLELEARPGGTSAYDEDGVVPYPWGAHYVPVPSASNRALVAVLDEMNALERGPGGELRGRERLLIREPEERLFLDGRWHEGLFPHAGASRDDLAELARFEAQIARWVAFRDGRGRRAFTLPMSGSSEDAEVTTLDSISAARWLDDQGLVSRRLRWYVEYACRDDYGLGLAQTSAWAMLFYFASRVPTPGAASPPFLAWPEGNGRLVKHLASVAADRLKTGVLVTDVVPREQAVEIHALDVRTETAIEYRADHVILAVPKFLARRIVRPWRESPPEFLRAFTYGSWLVANLHLARRPASRGFEPAWDNVLYDSPSLGYVAATHQALRDAGPTIWTYYRPFTEPDPEVARRSLAETGHAGFCDAIIADLGRAHDDLEDAIERIDVWRWGHAMVRPTPGFIWGPDRRLAAAPLGRIHFAHSDLSGLALFEEAQERGVRAAEAVLRERGREIQAL